MNVIAKELSKNFGNSILFNDIDINIESGSIVGIVGKSGCGKTTLINILSLIEPPTKGTISYDNSPICTDKERRKLLSTKIGIIFQDYGLLQNETVYQNFIIIKKIAQLNKTEQTRVIGEALKKVDITDKIHKKIYELSGGEQQRVAIAKVIAKKCDIIFADEPTASLDTNNKILVMNYFKQLSNDGTTVVIVTHDSEILSYFDKVIEIEKGG